MTRVPGMLLLLLLSLSLFSGAKAGYLAAKALLAQQLLQSAWQRTETNGRLHKPWFWADFSPVAKLSIPNAGIERFVLNATSGQMLAFGPGFVTNPDDPRALEKLVALGGHRDSHLAFLEHHNAADDIHIELPNGQSQRYREVERRIVDTTYETLSVNPDAQALLLITCYPFSALQTGGSQRLVVIAKPV